MEFIVLSVVKSRGNGNSRMLIPEFLERKEMQR